MEKSTITVRFGLWNLLTEQKRYVLDYVEKMMLVFSGKATRSREHNYEIFEYQSEMEPLLFGLSAVQQTFPEVYFEVM